MQGCTANWQCIPGGCVAWGVRWKLFVRRKCTCLTISGKVFIDVYLYEGWEEKEGDNTGKGMKDSKASLGYL